MTYKPIEDYGIIGNMHSAALVGMDGSIDWLCLPHFDSPSVFAAILDDEKGGHFQIAPANPEGVAYKQLYWPKTNVLLTRFLCADGVGQLIDYMPVGEVAEQNGLHQVFRRVKVVRGSLKFRLVCRPAFNYARDEHELTMSEEGACFRAPDLALGLASHVPLQRDGDGVVAEFALNEGETAEFVLRQIDPDAGCGAPLSQAEGEHMFRQTVNYWHRWLSQCTYTGRWREIVHRSALVLKLLTFEPTGAIVAAPTCSLPENIGGARNWDYRYTWIRDGAFTLYALMRIGFTEEAARFMEWLRGRIHTPNPDGSLQLMYGLQGNKELHEETLDHLDGYRGSRPVRIGNAAWQQFQLDIYGELMDSVYLYNKHGTPISYDLWADLSTALNWLVDNWQREDDGIWEVRGGQRQFVYSKLMSWVALDRGLRLAAKRSFPAERERWYAARDRIYQEIMEKGWSEKRQAFVQSYDQDTLDAANLIMPLVFFMSPTDPRMLKTIDAIMQPPDEGGLLSDSLVYRYDPEQTKDGVQGTEGTFNMCTFWLVEAQTRAGRVDAQRLREARLIFERMLGYANHLGLYAEQTGSRGQALGNFPQAFTHLALISAAFNLDRTLGPGA